MKYSIAGMVSVISVLFPILAQLEILAVFEKSNVELYFKWSLLIQAFLLTIPTIIWDSNVSNKNIQELGLTFSTIFGIYTFILLLVYFLFDEFILLVSIYTILKGLNSFLGSFYSIRKSVYVVIISDVLAVSLPLIVYVFDDFQEYLIVLTIATGVLSLIIILLNRDMLSFPSFNVIKESFKLGPERIIKYGSGSLEKLVFTMLPGFSFTDYSLVSKVLKPLSSLIGSGNFWVVNFVRQNNAGVDNEFNRVLKYFALTIPLIIAITYFVLYEIRFVENYFREYIGIIDNIKGYLAVALLGLFGSSIYSVFMKLCLAQDNWKLRLKFIGGYSIIYLVCLCILLFKKNGDLMNLFWIQSTLSSLLGLFVLFKYKNILGLLSMSIIYLLFLVL
jgi:hypothetical protein